MMKAASSSYPVLRKTPSPKQPRRVQTPVSTSPRGHRERSSNNRAVAFLCRYQQWVFLFLGVPLFLGTQWGLWRHHHYVASSEATSTETQISLDALLNEHRLPDRRHPVSSSVTMLRAKTGLRGKERTSKEAWRKRLLKFDPAEHAVLKGYQPSSSLPLQVVFIGSVPAFTEHVMLDGLHHSKYIGVVQEVHYDEARRSVKVKERHALDSKLPVVYMVDWDSLQRDCHVLNRIFRQMTALNATDSSYLVYVDWSASTRVISCPSVDGSFSVERIRHAKRSIVQDRYWNHSDAWVHPGTLIPNKKKHERLLQAPLVLSDGFVHAIRDGTDERELPNTQRHRDVTLFATDGDNSHYSFLQRQVGAAVVGLNGTSIHGQSIRWMVKSYSDPTALLAEERDRLQNEYIHNLLSTKIVVVAQKDEWEDHSVLLEALASGAMVMSDGMVAPTWGLKNRSNVVLYDSVDSLQKLVRYYLHPQNEKRRLSIAQRGWELAMTQHRSWARMETLLFGKVYSKKSARHGKHKGSGHPKH